MLKSSAKRSPKPATKTDTKRKSPVSYSALGVRVISNSAKKKGSAKGRLSPDPSRSELSEAHIEEAAIQSLKQAVTKV